MYFDMKSYLKNTYNHTAKHALYRVEYPCLGIFNVSIFILLSTINIYILFCCQKFIAIINEYLIKKIKKYIKDIHK